MTTSANARVLGDRARHSTSPRRLEEWSREKSSQGCTNRSYPHQRWYRRRVRDGGGGALSVRVWLGRRRRGCMLRARVPSCGGCRRGLCACRSHGRWVVRIASMSAALGRARGWRRLARAGVPCRSRAARVSRGPCQLRGRGVRSASTSWARGIRASRRCDGSLPSPPALIHDDATLGHHEVAHVLLVSLFGVGAFDVGPVDVLAVGVTLAHVTAP